MQFGKIKARNLCEVPGFYFNTRILLLNPLKINKPVYLNYPTSFPDNPKHRLGERSS